MEHPAPTQPRIVSVKNRMGGSDIRFAVHDMGVTFGSTFFLWCDIFFAEFCMMHHFVFSWASQREGVGQLNVCEFKENGNIVRMLTGAYMALYESELLSLAEKSRELLRRRYGDS